MKVRGLLAFLVAAAAIGIAASQALSASAATTWTVDKTTGTNNCAGNICKTIQKAVQKASDGDTIDVHKGLYSESVLVDKSLTFTGGTRPSLASGCSATTASSATQDTIVSAPAAAQYTFDIEADNVSFTGFVIQNTNANGWGVVVDLVGQAADWSGFTFKKNVFEKMGSGTTALFLSSNGSNPTLVQANCFRNNAEDAIFSGWGPTDTLKDVTVDANKFVKNTYGDVIFTDPDQDTISITGNISTTDGLFALLINTTNFTITGNISNKSNTSPTAEHAALYFGGNNSTGTIANNIVTNGTERAIAFDQTYTSAPNDSLTVSGNIFTGFAGNGMDVPFAQSLTNSTISGNIVNVKGTSGLFLAANNKKNSFSGNIFTGKTWGCQVKGNSVNGNNWNGSSNIGHPKNTPGTCFP